MLYDGSVSLENLISQDMGSDSGRLIVSAQGRVELSRTNYATRCVYIYETVHGESTWPDGKILTRLQQYKIWCLLDKTSAKKGLYKSEIRSDNPVEGILERVKIARRIVTHFKKSKALAGFAFYWDHRAFKSTPSSEQIEQFARSLLSGRKPKIKSSNLPLVHLSHLLAILFTKGLSEESADTQTLDKHFRRIPLCLNRGGCGPVPLYGQHSL